jgi:hypothetical protein
LRRIALALPLIIDHRHFLDIIVPKSLNHQIIHLFLFLESEEKEFISRDPAMAPPDLNSVPPSPHLRHTSQPPEPEFNPISPSTTQRASHVMGPPPMPANAMSSTVVSDPAGAGFGPGELHTHSYTTEP